jgi:hypothetical protein
MDQPIELPIADMVVGDSFFVPCIDDAEIKKRATKIANEYAVDLRVEKVVYHGMYGVRIWRI